MVLKINTKEKCDKSLGEKNIEVQTSINSPKNLTEAVSCLNEQKIETQSLFPIYLNCCCSATTSTNWIQEWLYWVRPNASIDQYVVSNVWESEVKSREVEPEGSDSPLK